MAQRRFWFEPLGDRHRALRAAFSSGVEPLDHYLRQQAGQEMRRGVAVVWVLYEGEDERVAGYYTLSASSVEPGDLPEATRRRLPRYAVLPVMLVGRLATDVRYRGQGRGGLLLLDALRRALDLAASVGTIAVIVDAKDDAAASFYERYGFQRFTGDTHRLFIPMETAAAAIRSLLPPPGR